MSNFYCILAAQLHTESNMDTHASLAALAALAQENRLAVFRLLVQTGPAGLAASKIAEHLAIPPSSLSFHLKELSNAGLLASRQEGRFVIYAANIDTMNGLIGFLTENCCAGAPCGAPSLGACAPK
jgi:ArsR family transcriptional regulator, arsenate/arsenite/antimonite-responsive transcriptional repressor